MVGVSRAVPPPWRDVLVAVALGAAAVVGALLADPSPRPLLPLGALLIAAGVLLLCWRRRFPVPVLAAVTVVVATYYWLDHPDGPASILVAAAVYTVASRVSWPRAVLAGMLLVLAWAGTEQVLVPATGGQAPPPGADHYGWIVVTVAVGVAVGAARRAAEASAERAEERLRRRVEQERLRIARDVHDVVSHSLSMIVVQAGVGAHVAARRPEEAVAALERIRDAGGAALRELRTTLRVLRADDPDDPDDSDDPDGSGRGPGGGSAGGSGPGAGPGGPAPGGSAPGGPAPGGSALGGPAGPGLDRLEEVVRAARSAGIAVTVTGTAGALPAETDRAAFAIVREAVTNTVRHAAHATAVRVSLARDAGGLRIRVADDGAALGVDARSAGAALGAGARSAGASPGAGPPAAGRDRAGQGLRGLVERAGTLGGTVRYGPAGDGFVVEAVLPVGVGAAVRPDAPGVREVRR